MVFSRGVTDSSTLATGKTNACADTVVVPVYLIPVG